jgi:hypothetical protein
MALALSAAIPDPRPDAAERPALLLLLAPADHPHRDAVCSTLAWLAAAEGSLFECYYDSHRTGSHFGGAAPGTAAAAEMRGGTFTGGRHLEQFSLLLQRFRCTVACLGRTAWEGPLEQAAVPVRAWSDDVAEFYRQVFTTSREPWPDTLLVVGEGDCPGVPLAPFAFPEVVHRRLLAIAGGDPSARAALGAGRTVESIWLDAEDRVPGDRALPAPEGASVAEQTAWMAQRWAAQTSGFLLGDPELVARWIPAAARHGWAPLHGLPQTDAVDRVAARLQPGSVVVGRQQDDRDFLALSRLGAGFQLVDPGRPPFPVLREAPVRWPRWTATADEPDDGELHAWARQGRVVSTLLFWTGMARELESLYALADVLSLTGLHAGLVLTTESFLGMPQPPLTLATVPRQLGGLAPRVELLLASGGQGALLEAEAPPGTVGAMLGRARELLAEVLGEGAAEVRGWWSVMDAPLQHRGTHRLGLRRQAPFVAVRYRQRDIAEQAAAGAAAGRRSLRTVVRDSPLRHLAEPLRPFDGWVPGPPSRSLLAEVRDAGFEYAFTKSGFGGPPRVVAGVDGLTALTYTAGRWDGWTPFVTVNTLADLRRAERRLLRRGRPGWLAGALDACLWAFSGPLWSRATDLHAICAWMAAGGSSGRLLNVTPRTAARYAAVLAAEGQVETLPAR